MALTKMAFSPTDGLRNTVTYPRVPADETAAREQIQGRLDEVQDYLNDTLTAQQDTKNTTYDAHLAETVSHMAIATRDVSVTGVQTVTLPFKAKSLTVLATISGTKSISNGVWAENNVQRTIAQVASTSLSVTFSGAIYIGVDGANFATGTIQNVTATGFEINWAKTGAPTGTASIFILASTH